jgi:hypothetical protein
MCRHIARAILSNRSRSTILHSSKDLAVSPVCLHTITPEGALAFRHRRHCSHLLGYPRQALPATLPLNCSRDKCSDFPLSTIINNMASDHSTRNPQTIQYFPIFSKCLGYISSRVPLLLIHCNSIHYLCKILMFDSFQKLNTIIRQLTFIR